MGRGQAPCYDAGMVGLRSPASTLVTASGFPSFDSYAAPVGHTRTAVSGPIRWGIGDFAWAWPAVLVSQVFFGAVIVSLRGFGPHHAADAIDIAFITAGSTIVTLGILRVIAAVKGGGSLRTDFGLTLRLTDWPWLAAGVLVGLVANGSVLIIEAVAGSKQQQDVAIAIQHSPTAARVLGALAVVIAAPLGEELLFRGLLLRGLSRRFGAVTAVAGSAGLFALVHLLDPNAAPFLAPLALLGMISGMRAVRSGELSQSILLHAGFNLLSAIALLAS